MDDGGGFPSINYVPIPQGGNMLEGLLQLYGAYKGYKQQQQTNDYLKTNSPAPGVTNVGALQGWQEAGKGLQTQAETGMDKSDALYKTALTNYLPQQDSMDWTKTMSGVTQAAADTSRANTEAGDLKLKSDPNSPENLAAAARNTNEATFQTGELAVDKDRVQATRDDTALRSQDQLEAHQDQVKSSMEDHLNNLLKIGDDNPAMQTDPVYRRQVTNEAKLMGLPDPYYTPQGPPDPNSDAAKNAALLKATSETETSDPLGTPGLVGLIKGPSKDYGAGAAPGSIDQPALPPAARVGGDSDTARAQQSQALLDHIYNQYSNDKDYESRHGALVDPKSGKPVPVDTRYSPQLLKTLKERYQIEQQQNLQNSDAVNAAHSQLGF